MRSWILSSLVVVLALNAPARAIDPKYLPADAEAVITINLKAMLESDLAKSKKELVEKVKEQIRSKLADSPVKEYLDKAGFDLLRDLHTITVASNGSKDKDKLFIAIEGNFNTDKLIDAAQDAARDNGDALKLSKIANVQVFEISPKGGDEQTVYASVLNGHVLIAAPSREVLGATIGRANGARTTVRASLRALLDTTNSKQALSIVFTGTGIANAMSDAPIPPQAGEQLQGIDGLSVGLTVAKDISFQVAATSKDEDSAKKLSGMANLGLLGIRGMIQKKAQDDQKAQLVLEVANTLRVTQQGTTVSLRGEISQENFDRILALLPKR